MTTELQKRLREACYCEVDMPAPSTISYTKCLHCEARERIEALEAAAVSVTNHIFVNGTQRRGVVIGTTLRNAIYSLADLIAGTPPHKTNHIGWCEPDCPTCKAQAPAPAPTEEAAQ